MGHEVVETPEGKKLILEDYLINGRHFTRSIFLPHGQEHCEEVVSIDSQLVADEVTWRLLLTQARNAEY